MCFLSCYGLALNFEATMLFGSVCRCIPVMSTPILEPSSCQLAMRLARLYFCTKQGDRLGANVSRSAPMKRLCVCMMCA